MVGKSGFRTWHAVQSSSKEWICNCMSDAGLQSKQKGSNPRKVVVSFWSRKLWDAWVVDVKLRLEDDFNELEGTVCAVGKTHVEKKAKLKDRLLQAQAQAALEGLCQLCHHAMRSGQHTVCAGRPRFVRSSCLPSQYNVLQQVRIYNHTGHTL